nr:hypothetical protein [Tanacetum cinerariifolium]
MVSLHVYPLVIVVLEEWWPLRWCKKRRMLINKVNWRLAILDDGDLEKNNNHKDRLDNRPAFREVIA